MKFILRIFLFFCLLVLVSSCSSSRKSITHRKSERKAVRKRPIPEAKVYTQVRDEIVLQAIKYIGRDYRYGGKSPSKGFDCSGLISYVYKKAGLNVQGASHQQAKLGKWKSRASLEPGDLVFFGKGKKVSHVAIVVRNKNDQLEVIHSTSSSGVRVDEISHSPYWNKRYLFSRDVISRDSSYASGK